jgi:lipopolysaccharide transport system ATP-binding protein
MSETAIKFENISKQYRLGLVGTGTITHDLNRWWHVVRGKEDPYLKIGEVNDRSAKAHSKYIWALKDISFDVKQGEVLGIIGKNGAGKSTLLKILSRVTSPSTGSIKAKGRIASLLEVGTGFHPEMTGRENIFMNGSIMGMTKAEIKRKLDEIVDFAGVEKYIDTPVKRYSSGMTVRLGFAIAAHLEPEILVVDEVLAVGDAEFQKKAIGKMKDVSTSEGRTVLFVSHNMASIQLLCPSSVVLENGGISHIGSTTEAVNIYYSQSGNNEINVARRTDRKGNGIIRVVDIEVYALSNDNQQRLTPQLGNPIYFEFTLNNKGVLKSDKFRFDFRVESNNGMRVGWFSTLLKSIYTLNGDKIIFSMPKCPFNYGKYFITFSCTLNGETTDWIQNACSFEVKEGLFFNTDMDIPKEQTPLYHDFDLIIK